MTPEWEPIATRVSRRFEMILEALRAVRPETKAWPWIMKNDFFPLVATLSIKLGFRSDGENDLVVSINCHFDGVRLRMSADISGPDNEHTTIVSDGPELEIPDAEMVQPVAVMLEPWLRELETWLDQQMPLLLQYAETLRNSGIHDLCSPTRSR